MNVRRGRYGKLLVTTVAVASLAACLPIPVDYYAKGARENVSPKTADKIQRCVSTKEDILLMLGEPDLVSKDERRFGYGWGKTKILWIVPGGNIGLGGGWSTSYEGGISESTRSYLLEVSFDENDLVTEVSLVKKWSSHTLP